MNDQEKIIWLSGLLEGEGSFSSHKNSPVIHLMMTDRDIIIKAAEIMSCSYGVLTRVRNKKTAWQTSLWGLKAIIMMRKILPYMGERRTVKINELLSLDSNRRKRAS